MKQACFEEGSQSADMKYPLIGLSRRCNPFLGYLRAKSRLTAVALRNAPAGAVPRTPFLTVAENLLLYRQPQADAGFILRLLFAVDRKNYVYRTLERKAFGHRTELLQKMADIAEKTPYLHGK